MSTNENIKINGNAILSNNQKILMINGIKFLGKKIDNDFYIKVTNIDIIMKSNDFEQVLFSYNNLLYDQDYKSISESVENISIYIDDFYYLSNNGLKDLCLRINYIDSKNSSNYIDIILVTKLLNSTK